MNRDQAIEHNQALIEDDALKPVEKRPAGQWPAEQKPAKREVEPDVPMGRRNNGINTWWLKDACQQYGIHAVNRLVELMYSDDERVALLACRELLDRGFGRPAKVTTMEKGDHPQLNITVKYRKANGS